MTTKKEDGHTAGLADVTELVGLLREVAATYQPAVVRAALTRAVGVARPWVNGVRPIGVSAAPRVPGPPVGRDPEYDEGYRQAVRQLAETIASVTLGIPQPMEGEETTPYPADTVPLEIAKETTDKTERTPTIPMSQLVKEKP